LGPDGDVFDPIREAFEAVEVEVAALDLHEAKEQSAAPAITKPADELAQLKARATELGLNFNPNIGLATLKARVAAKEAEVAKNDDSAPAPADEHASVKDEGRGDGASLSIPIGEGSAPVEGEGEGTE
jgi:hypothetical protein